MTEVYKDSHPKIVMLDSTNPYTNISREYCYYENLQHDEMIFLVWQNEPCVVIGRNQNIYRELDLAYMNQQNILPVRRFTGGGSVYQDLGNLNFTFISSQKNKEIEAWVTIIVNALKLEGIKAEVVGRNDLLVNGKKVSGMAWLEDEEKFLIHGTLMVHLDQTNLSKCLTPDISKFIGKGIKSVTSRVVNLKELNPFITMEGLKRSLVKALKERYPKAMQVKHTKHPEESRISEMLRSKEFIFGKNEKAQIQRNLTIGGKPLGLSMYINQDLIQAVDIYTDSLDLKGIEKMKHELIGKAYKDLNMDEVITSICEKSWME